MWKHFSHEWLFHLDQVHIWFPHKSPANFAHRGIVQLPHAEYAIDMGRNLPSTTQMVFEQIAELRPFYEALRRSDQLILDKFFEAVLFHRSAIGNAAGLLPMEIMPWVLLLEERKRINHLLSEIYNQMQDMEKRVSFLSQPSLINKKHLQSRLHG